MQVGHSFVTVRTGAVLELHNVLKTKFPGSQNSWAFQRNYRCPRTLLLVANFSKYQFPCTFAEATKSPVMPQIRNSNRHTQTHLKQSHGYQDKDDGARLAS